MRSVAVIRCWVLYSLEPAHGLATRFVGVLGIESRSGSDVVGMRVSWVPLVDRGEWEPRLHGRTEIGAAELDTWVEFNNGIVVDMFPIPAPDGRDLLTSVEVLVEELLACGAGD
jgi:hypothetical protein